MANHVASIGKYAKIPGRYEVGDFAYFVVPEEG